MLRKLTLLSLIVLSLAFFSCHKSNDGGGSGQLAGNYTLLYLSAQIQAISEQSGGGQTEKTVSNSNYTTVQNTGTITFTKDSILSKGVAYTANFTAISYVYENGVLFDSLSFPFTESLPSFNSSTKYDVIGKDSVYFHGGYLTPTFSGGTTLASPSGGRFSFKGDTLFLISKVNQVSPSQTIGGVKMSSSVSGVATIVLLKQ